MKKNILITCLFALLLLGATFSSDSFLFVPVADSVDNVTMRDVIGNKDDVGNGGTSLISLTKQIRNDVVPTAEHHEHIFPKSDGIGGAGTPFSISSDSQDEDTGAQSNQDYWGEPVKFDPSETGEWRLLGYYVEADTASKTFQYHVFIGSPSLSSAKSGGVAWDKTTTVLSVVDGSSFATSDFVAIVSDYKVEIQRVVSVATNDVTIVREAHAVGINGLRWDHTTNDPGTEVLYRVGRPTEAQYHPMGGLYSAASSKESARLSLHAPRLIEGNGFVLIRTLNQTDGLNGAAFRFAIIYED